MGTKSTDQKFNLSASRLVEWLLPVGLRAGSVVALMRTAFSAYQSAAGREDLHSAFAASRAEDRFRLEHNGQVCYLRSALNKRFKSSLPGVWFRIADPSRGLEWLCAGDEIKTKEHIHANYEVKRTYTVVLQSAGKGVDEVIKLVAEVLDIDSAAARKILTETPPLSIKEFDSFAQADALKARFDVTGATATIAETKTEHIYAPNETRLKPSNTFIIYVPSDLYYTQLDRIKQFVGEYKLVTRKPQYEPINS